MQQSIRGDSAWTSTAAEVLRGALESLVSAGHLPGGVAIAGTRESAEYVWAGALTPELPETPTGPHIHYDVASLTKVMATWPLAGWAVADGRLDLDAPVGTYVSLDGDYPGGAVTARQILTHTSRLDPVTGFERYVGTGRDLAEALLAEPLRESGHRYIDRGFILLGLLLERVYGRRLNLLAAELWKSIGLAETTFGPVAPGLSVAPTERRLAGAAPAWGVVHDESAALMGGVAGHAGVFSTAADLARFAQSALASWTGAEDAVAPPDFARESIHSPLPLKPGLRQGLAWLVAGQGVAYHNGYTGTCLAVRPETGRFTGVLTNAVHYGRARVGLDALRRAARTALA